jgi:hypothetical protein
MTGDKYSNCVDFIAEDNGAIAWIHETYIKPPKKQAKSKKTAVPRGTSCLSDDELIKMATKKDETFEPLWQGVWVGKYNSQSEADMALCGKLAWWGNCDVSQIDRLFRQSGLMRDKWSGNYITDTINTACNGAVDPFVKIPTRKSPKEREVAIFERGGCYYLKRGESIKQLTNYIIVGIEMLETSDETLFLADFITEKGQTFTLTFLAEDFSSLDKFKKITTKKQLALSYMGTSGDLEIFKAFVHDLDWNVKRGVKTLGIYNHEDELTFVSTSGAVKASNIPVDTIIQIDKENFIDSKILEKSFLGLKQFKQLGEHILTYNEYPKTVSVLAWAAGCFIKYHLRESETKYPHCIMCGISGSGKSFTMEYIVCPMFSRYVILASSQATSFGLMRESSSSNLVPQFINEFKPATLDPRTLKAILNHLRDTYDKHEGMRGDSTLRLNKYELLAPVIIAGEQSPAESAIRERTIELLFSPNELENSDYEPAYNWICENKSTFESFGRTLLDVALKTTPEEANGWYKEGFERVKGNFPSRVTKNLACTYAGLKLVEKMCIIFKQRWEDVFPIDIETCVNHLIYGVREYLLDGKNRSKTVIEETFEIMARMGLKYDKDYVFENSGKELCIRLSHIYDDYTGYRQRNAILGEVLGLDDFKKQLGKSGYLLAKSVLREYGEKRFRSWVIDYEKLQSVCDVSGFVEGGISSSPPTPPTPNNKQ